MALAIAFSPDHKLLATGSNDGIVEVWEVTNGRQVMRLEHLDRVNAVAFSPDGRLLATVSTDRTTRIWEIVSGQQFVRINDENNVQDVAFNPNGRYLATASSNIAEIKLWRPEDLIAAVRPKLTRNLTPKEWKQFLGDEPYSKTFEDLP